MKQVLFWLGVLILAAGCSVQIYDLQPIIVGTDTPTATAIQQRVFVTSTPTVTARYDTPTPPVHLAPTAISSKFHGCGEYS